MHITFWGTRGSIPTPLAPATLRQKLRQALAGSVGLDLRDTAALERYLDRLPPHIQSTVGGNTTCLEIGSADRMLMLDAGSGLRLLGLDLMQRGGAQGNQHFHLLLTHTHWDHIQGFPFFAPAFNPTNQITFSSPYPELLHRLEQQQAPCFFPLPLHAMPATFQFQTIAVEQWTEVNGFRVYPFPLAHPGGSYGYRIEDGNTCLVHASDAEYPQVDTTSTQHYMHLFQGADLLIFDAQYSLRQALDKPEWGHSSALIGAELARRAGVRRLVLFHHDPTSSDEQIWAARDQAEAYLQRGQPHPPHPICEVLVAYEGLHLAL